MKYSETMVFVNNVALAAEPFRKLPDTKVLEQVGDHWLLLEVSGARIGLLSKSAWKGEDSPAPRIAFQSTDLDGDAKLLADSGFLLDDIHRGKELHSVTFQDRDGNRYLVWQDAVGTYVSNSDSDIDLI